MLGFCQRKMPPSGREVPPKEAEGEKKYTFSLFTITFYFILSPPGGCAASPLPEGASLGFCLKSLPPGGEGGPKGRMRGQGPFGIMLFRRQQAPALRYWIL